MMSGCRGVLALDRRWPPLGHPWSDVLGFFNDVGKHFAPNVKCYKAFVRNFVNKWRQAHLQQKLKDFQTCNVLLLLLKTKPQVFKKKVGGLPKGKQFNSIQLNSLHRLLRAADGLAEQWCCSCLESNRIQWIEFAWLQFNSIQSMRRLNRIESKYRTQLWEYLKIII